jgi:hypothetical protein
MTDSSVSQLSNAVVKWRQLYRGQVYPRWVYHRNMSGIDSDFVNSVPGDRSVAFDILVREGPDDDEEEDEEDDGEAEDEGEDEDDGNSDGYSE